MALRDTKRASRVEADTTLHEIVELIRTGAAATRPELGAITGLTRAVISQRVDQAIAATIIDDGTLAVSTGGRAPRRLRFRAEAGVVYSAVLGSAHVCVGVSDLAGASIGLIKEPWPSADDPEQTLDRLATLFDRIGAEHPNADPLWAIGIGLPGAVDFHKARASRNHDFPRWNDFEVRARLEDRYKVPVWVDNDLNTLALREQTQAARTGIDIEDDFILIKASNGIGASIVSGGQVQRGHNGTAGAIGHAEVLGGSSFVCRCGQTGCLETVASGRALVRDARAAAAEGRSDYLSEILDARGALTPDDLRVGALRYDPVCLELIERSATHIGAAVATLVSYLNPAKILIGGILPAAGDVFLAGVREAAYRHGLPVATRDLQIISASLRPEEAVSGAAMLAVDQLFASRSLPIWLPTSAESGTATLYASSVR